MTRVFLAAGVAALAIAVPATAGPGGHGNPNRDQQAQRGGGGGGRAAAMMRGGGGGFAVQRQQRQAAPRVERQQRMAAIERPQRAQRQQVQARMAGRQQVRANRQQAQARMAERQQVRGNRQQAQNRVAERQQVRANRQQQAQARMAQRQQMQANRQQAQNRMAQRQQMQANRQQQAQNRMAQQQQLRANRQQQVQAQIAARQQLRANRVNERVAANNGVGYGVGGCPRGLAGKGCTPPGIARQQGLNALARQQQLMALRTADPRVFQQSRLQMLAPRTRIVGPARAVEFIGQPLSTVSNVVPLAALPASLGYLYPSTPNYYYQYGGGYLYQVDRSTSLIDALIPLLAGGYLPGTYLPSAYMNSYVPNYYGLNNFYPSSYAYGYGSGYGYNNLCNRYAYGNVYQVDCVTGMVVNVIPMYAGGYGVGQMLPSAYNYYNVPMQYRSMYYPTSDYSYWYAPGAIYQYDPSNSLITSVAALLSPGFTIGQPLPAGYGMYNVPLAYRSTYYDTPDAWYRYNNGYIYQVNPATQLVTAVVASLLT